jgi:hypothetical protein
MDPKQEWIRRLPLKTVAVRGSAYVAAFACCRGRMIIFANAAVNRKVNVLFLFILPNVITTKDGFRYIFYVLIEV